MNKSFVAIWGLGLAIGLTSPCRAQLRTGADTDIKGGDQTHIGADRSSASAWSGAHLNNTKGQAHVDSIESTTSTSSKTQLKANGASSGAHIDANDQGRMSSGTAATGSTKGLVTTRSTASGAHIDASDQTHLTSMAGGTTAATSTKAGVKTNAQLNANAGVNGHPSNTQVKSDAAAQTDTSVH